MLTALLIALAINFILFLVAFAAKTDKLTDASYGLTFIALAIWGAARAPSINLCNGVLLVMIVIWALRLGGFLVLRIMKTGRDKRFDGRRESFWKFGGFWLSQALTVWVVMLAASQALVRTADLRITALIGLFIWLAGLKIETLADLQKLAFRGQPANKGRWITSGLWRYSRHPNYFGEMLVWVGVYIYAAAALPTGQALVGVLSPLTIIILLRFVSGIPPLEKMADERWGKLKDYQAYKARTSLLIPWPNK